jgi:hypothetical protein
MYVKSLAPLIRIHMREKLLARIAADRLANRV